MEQKLCRVPFELPEFESLIGSTGILDDVAIRE